MTFDERLNLDFLRILGIKFDVVGFMNFQLGFKFVIKLLKYQVNMKFFLILVLN